MRAYCRRGNFSRPENLHLTLRFLGEVDRNGLPAIEQAMDEAAQGAKPFQLQLGSWGHFSRGAKKILWVGLQGEVRYLHQLFQWVEEALVLRGFPRETRKLRAHITMAREAVLNDDWNTLVGQLTLEPRQLPVKGITLMESTRVNGVLTYLPLYESFLGK